MMPSSRMGLPSSVTAMAPAACKARKSVSVAPLLARVAAAMANTLTTAPRAGWRSQSIHSTESTTGIVLGMVQTEVNPPAAAAAVPVAIVSFCAWPGSRRCTCRSMKPGATMSPRASNFSSALPLILLGAATSATRPSFSSTSIDASVRGAGSMRCPPLISRLPRFFSAFVIIKLLSHLSHGTRQNRHAHRDAVAHFFQYPRLSAISDLAGQFESANDGSGMHDDGIFLCHFQPGRSHLVAHDIFGQIDFQPSETLFLH